MLLLSSRVEKQEWEDLAFIRSTPGNMWLCAVSDRYKLVVSSEDDPWLFDLDKDPDELVNRVGDPALNETLRTFAEEFSVTAKSTMTLTVRIRKFRRVSQRY